jgi:hypothetical protein
MTSSLLVHFHNRFYFFLVHLSTALVCFMVHSTCMFRGEGRLVTGNGGIMPLVVISGFKTCPSD